MVDAYVFIYLLLYFFSRESLIDKRIESAVSQMQSVIELGRVIRERKTLPIKVNHPFYLNQTYTRLNSEKILIKLNK